MKELDEAMGALYKLLPLGACNSLHMYSLSEWQGSIDYENGKDGSGNSPAAALDALIEKLRVTE